MAPANGVPLTRSKVSSKSLASRLKSHKLSGFSSLIPMDFKRRVDKVVMPARLQQEDRADICLQLFKCERGNEGLDNLNIGHLDHLQLHQYCDYRLKCTTVFRNQYKQYCKCCFFALPVSERGVDSLRERPIGLDARRVELGQGSLLHKRIRSSAFKSRSLDFTRPPLPKHIQSHILPLRPDSRSAALALGFSTRFPAIPLPLP